MDLQLNQIIKGHALDVLRDFPDEYVDCVITSPPYWGLRDYKVEPTVWGNQDCQHEWGDEMIKRSYGNVGLRPNVGNQKVDAMVGSEKKGNSCLKCNAWKGQLGLEPTFELFIDHLIEIFAEVKRVLKKTGTLWVVLGDSYFQTNVGNYQGDLSKSSHGHAEHLQITGRTFRQKQGIESKSLCNIPHRFAIAMTDRLGMILRNTVIWHKPNCLGGTVPVYIRSQGKPLRTTIREMARLPLNDLFISGINGWRKVLEIQRNPKLPILVIHLRNGTKIRCTADHLFPVSKNLLRADQLQKGMKLGHHGFNNEGTSSNIFATRDIAWLIGLYLAEGSKSQKTIQFSLSSNEDSYAKKLEIIAKQLGCLCKSYTYKNSLAVHITGSIIHGIINHYVEGYGAKKKHLSRKAFCENNEFLESLLIGYLEGDGHYDESNKRWRLGFTRNKELEFDLKTLCNRLGYHMRSKSRKAKYQNGYKPIIQGEIRKETSGHFNQKDDYEVLRIIKAKAGTTYKIEVDQDNLFTLYDGTLVHNCMPQSAKDRFTVDFEYVFMFTRQGKYYFKQLFEDNQTQGDWREAPIKAHGNGETSLTKGYNRVGSINQGRNKRCVWTIPTQPSPEAHFAIFPQALVQPMIEAGCPEQICKKCGKAREVIYKRQDVGRSNSNTKYNVSVDTAGRLAGKRQAYRALGLENPPLPEPIGLTNCGCNAGWVSGIVCDPFSGTGTTCYVAKEMGRRYIGIDISPQYVGMAEKKNAQEMLL